MQVVVNNPPNLYDETGREEFKRLMGAFEGTEYTMNHNATMVFCVLKVKFCYFRFGGMLTKRN